MTESFSIVVPTVGRPSLGALLRALGAGWGPAPEKIVVVDDRRETGGDLPGVDDHPRLPVRVVRSEGRGPAAARNVGWRTVDSDWVAFLDDDVIPEAMWQQRLAADLAGLPPDVAGSQGRIIVPRASGRPATDWERNVQGLESARWATADLAYRRDVLDVLGGFDERFPRAFREDADLGLRAVASGFRIVSGGRTVFHPARPADRWVSVRLQRGNADDALMRRLHGNDWHERAGAPRGRLRRHAAVTACGLLAAGAAMAKHRAVAVGAGAAWLLGTAEFAWKRISPGPRTREEITTMVTTSCVIPAAAVAHRLAGELAWRGAARHPAAVLFDRDGTLVVDVPYNARPERVQLMPGAREALDRLRAAGVRIGVVSNQSGVGRGLLDASDVEAVNRRVEELVGRIDTWAVCPHAPEDRCSCRKPEPGLVRRAAADLGVAPKDCVVVGDIGADVAAAEAAGATGILVPTPKTRQQEVEDASVVVRGLPEAVDHILGEHTDGRPS